MKGASVSFLSHERYDHLSQFTVDVWLTRCITFPTLFWPPCFFNQPKIHCGPPTTWVGLFNHYQDKTTQWGSSVAWYHYILSTLSSQPHCSHVRWYGCEGTSSLQGATHRDSLHGRCECCRVLCEGGRGNVENIGDPTRVNLETLEDNGVWSDTLHYSHLS